MYVAVVSSQIQRCTRHGGLLFTWLGPDSITGSHFHGISEAELGIHRDSASFDANFAHELAREDIVARDGAHPHSETITSNAMKLLLVPISMSMLMDEDDAKLCLKVVEKTVSTRATKRALAKKWTQTLEEAHAEERGKKRAAKRAAIGARAPKTGRCVHRCGCSHVF